MVKTKGNLDEDIRCAIEMVRARHIIPNEVGEALNLLMIKIRRLEKDIHELAHSTDRQHTEAKNRW